MKNRVTHLLPLLLAGVALSPAVSHAQSLYTITDLGTLGGNQSSASGVNDAGQVVGTSTTTYGVSRAFAYGNGAMIDLGTLGGDYSSASAINDQGEVVGTSTTTYGVSRAFLFANGVMYDLGTLGGDYSSASGINNNGQIVGESTISPGASTVTVLASGLNNYNTPKYGVGPLVLDGDTIYFEDNFTSSGCIKSVPKDGGPVTTLASGGILLANRAGLNLIVDSTSIYDDYSTYDSGYIFSFPKTGGDGKLLATQYGGYLIGKVGNDLYYGANFSTIMKVPASGGTATQITSVSGLWARATAYDNSAIYFQDYWTHSVFRLDATTEVLTTLVPNLPQEYGINVDQNYLYVNLGNQIDRVPKTGGAITVLGQYDWSPISDGTYYYFTDGTTISRRAIGGGPVTNFLTQPAGSVRYLITDGTKLFWVDSTGGDGAGRILAASIPATPPPSSSVVRAFLFSYGTMYDLGTLGGDWSSASAINDAVVVAGTSETVFPEGGPLFQGDQHAFVFSNGVMQALSTLGGPDASIPTVYVAAINNSNQVAGYEFSSLDDVSPRGFLFSGGTTTYFSAGATTSTVVNGMNNYGQIVGDTSNLPGDPNPEAFLYTGGTTTLLKTVVDLSHSNFDLLETATAISDNGYIVGTGKTRDGLTHAFLLTPIPPPSP